MERELILKAKAGDGLAWNHLLQGYVHRVYRAAYCMIKNVDDAADLSQEAFIRAFKNIQTFDENRSFYPWIYKIVHNLCLNHLKQHTHREQELPEIAGSMPDPQSALLKKEQALNLKKAMNQLPERFRNILVLKTFDGCSYAEIADILSIPIGTVMSRLYNARKLLRERLQEIEG